MKTIIIGGVAAGTKAAAKLKRETPQDEIVIYTKGKDISYAGCGLPYYIGGAIETEEELIVNTPAKFMGLTGAEVHTGCEVTAVDPAGKTVTIGKDGEETVSYDRLVIAVGAVGTASGRNRTSRCIYCQNAGRCHRGKKIRRGKRMQKGRCRRGRLYRA